MTVDERIVKDLSLTYNIKKCRIVIKNEKKKAIADIADRMTLCLIADSTR